MAQDYNGFSGPIGATCTAANSAVGTVTLTGGTAVISSAVLYNGALSALLTGTTSSGLLAFVKSVGSTALAAAIDLFLTAAPSAALGVLAFHGASRNVSVDINTNRTITLRDGANTALWTSTGVVPLNGWCRIALCVPIQHATAGTVRAAIFADNDATPMTGGDSTLLTGRNTGADAYTTIRGGVKTTTTNATITGYVGRLSWNTTATDLTTPWVAPTVSTQAVGLVPVAELRMSDLDVPPFDDLTLTEFFGEMPATPAGGSAATSTATAPGAGQKATTGSAAATTSATTPSAGHKASQGAATATADATATAGGIKRPTSGTAATSAATSTGAGSKLGQDAAHAIATATTTGGGERISAGAGGSAATATATSVGAGHKLTPSGSSATATAATTAAGHKQGLGASGATSTGTTSGAGYTRRSGGTNTTATAAGLGDGRKLTPGGSPAVATAATTGMGVRLTWGGNYAGVTAGATGGGVSTSGWRDVTLTATDRCPTITAHDRHPTLISWDRAATLTATDRRRHVVATDRQSTIDATERT